MFTVFCEMTFDAAHSLPSLPEGHKCRGVHGHSYRVVVEVSGELNEHGFVVDYGEIKEVLGEAIARVDHTNLNDMFDRPSTEILAEYFWQMVSAEIGGVSAVTVYETPGNGCRYVP
jgi:6-pyruvoyltetrahydropterin/6-carboxytetrahydropterin synthase